MYGGLTNFVNATGGFDVLSDVFQNGRLLKSSDGGLSFQSVDLVPSSSATILSVDFIQTDATGQHVLVCATEFGGSYINNDAGSELDQLRTTWLYQPNNPNTLATYYSANGGVSWTRSVLGSEVTTNNGTQTFTLSQDVVTPLQLSNDGTTMYALMNTLVTTIEGDESKTEQVRREGGKGGWERLARRLHPPPMIVLPTLSPHILASTNPPGQRRAAVLHGRGRHVDRVGSVVRLHLA